MSDMNRALLENAGFVTGARDPLMNTAFNGAFMVAEPYPKGVTQQDAQGGDGVWCIVGDDLDLLRQEAVDFWGFEADLLAPWDEEDDTSPMGYAITQDQQALNIIFENDTKIWIELENNKIRVHCFSAVDDEPTTVEIDREIACFSS